MFYSLDKETMSESSNNEDSQLSSEELRSKLFHTFRSKGVLQSVKVCVYF